jgi:hypothetical protein
MVFGVKEAGGADAASFWNCLTNEDAGRREI